LNRPSERLKALKVRGTRHREKFKFGKRVCISLRMVTTCPPYPRETFPQFVIPAKSGKAGREPC
jgi:hypothetical protein